MTSTTSTSMILNINPITIVSSYFQETENENLLTIIKRQSVFYAYSSVGTTTTDRVWKEIYGVKNGKLELIQTVYGKIVPAYNVSEKIEFED